MFHLEKNVNRGDAEDLYLAGKDFTPTTVPNSLTYGGTDNQINITNISAAAPVMTATIGLSAVPPSDCIIKDPGFEAGTPNSFWTEASTNFGTPLCDASCGAALQRTGSWWAWFGGTTSVEDGSLEQGVTIPAGAESLTFYLWVPYTIYAGDYLRVSVDGTQLWEVTTANNIYASGYTQISIDISAYADNAPHTLRLYSHINNNPTPPSFMVDDLCLTTLNAVPSVSTQAVNSVGTTTALGNGTIISLGSPNPSQHGICWNTAGTPTVSDSCGQEGAASAVGPFTSAMTGLAPNTTYYVRAYATNTAGTSYGDQVSFSTSTPVAPTVTTQAVSGISSTTATGNGTITSLGAPDPTQHGVCWNTTGTPTTGDACTQEGPASATGPFASAMTGLAPNTTYHVRAYATNTAGTAYGGEVSFTTVKNSSLLLLYLPAIIKK